MNELEHIGTERGYQFYRLVDGTASRAVKKGNNPMKLYSVSIEETPSGRWSVRLSVGRFSGVHIGTYKKLARAFDIAEMALETEDTDF